MINPADLVAKRRATLERLHPVKVEARAKARELYSRQNELKNGATERATVRELVDNHPFDLFPTPPELARRMVRLAIPDIDNYPGGPILEPSAGTGNIAEAIREYMPPGYCIECVELNYQAAKYLEQSKGFPTLQGDFLTMELKASAVIMNPPFSNGQDIDHVLHAFECLNPGGRIVAIMSAGTMYRQDKKAAAFRQWLSSHQVYFEELPEGTFKQSGTMVKSILLVIE